MLGRWKVRIVGIAALVLVFMSVPSLVKGWEGGFTVYVSYQELTGEQAGLADVTLVMIIPMGTPLLAREAAISSGLAALRDIWNLESVHEEVTGFIGPQIPMDVQRVVAKIDGSHFISAIIDSFVTVENAGFPRFQEDTSIVSTERLPAGEARRREEYPNAPRFFEWVVGGIKLQGPTRHENWVIASLINYSAALLSFRSEFGRFPSSFAELRETGHLFIEPLNPYTGEKVRVVNEASAGDITYQLIDNNRAVLLTYIKGPAKVEVVRREINLYYSGAFDLLYRQTAGLSEEDKQVARYVFQISQILNEYYAQHHDLPYSVPQCETEGFAYVSFPNPYAGRDALQADSLATILPGDYVYHRVSKNAYFLAGYGIEGRPVLSISKDFSAAILAPSQGEVSAR